MHEQNQFYILNLIYEGITILRRTYMIVEDKEKRKISGVAIRHALKKATSVRKGMRSIQNTDNLRLNFLREAQGAKLILYHLLLEHLEEV